MPKRFIGIRLEEELLSLKPEGVSYSDWIRECVHIWKLTKEGEIKELLKGLEELSQKVEKVKECPDLLEAKKVIKSLEKVAFSLNEFISDLRTSLRVLSDLENLVEEIESFRRKVEETLVYRKPAWERSSWNGSWEVDDEEAI